MNEDNILNLVSKFEKSLQETENLTNALMGLEGVLEKLDTSMTEVYELTKVENLTEKSLDLVDSVNKLKKAQQDVSREYNELLNLSLYKENLKSDVNDLKKYLIKIDNDLSNVKVEIENQRIFYENENKKFQRELILHIRELLNPNNDEVSLDKSIEEINNEQL
ncbi:MAG: hypothetical protein ACRC3Y_08010 [Romboutsia sp.]|uniref:hypothetical protein n=1 Tax=Romboutsia sp. TaxID=1965302 RepID=UPI003F2ADC0C